MATKWVHKEAIWKLHGSMVHNEYEGSYHLELISYDEDEDGRTFIQWLDFECEEGWEVLKISRDFQDEQSKTWALFRKQV